MRGSTVQIDHAGRLVLPKRLRERFRLRGGDALAIEVRGDAIEFRPVSGSGTLKRVNGVLVFSGGTPLEGARDFVAEARDERLDDLAPHAKGRP